LLASKVLPEIADLFFQTCVFLFQFFNHDSCCFPFAMQTYPKTTERLALSYSFLRGAATRISSPTTQIIAQRYANQSPRRVYKVVTFDKA
jgi:hypothetical protein